MAHDVFLSYSSRDQAAAEKICTALEGAHIKCWIAPRDIVSGSQWGASIVYAIESCRAVVVVFSEHSNASQQVIREMEAAVSRKRPLVPVRVANVVPTADMQYFLGVSHWFDAFPGPIETYLYNIVLSVRRVLEGTVPTGNSMPVGPGGTTVVQRKRGFLTPAISIASAAIAALALTVAMAAFLYPRVVNLFVANKGGAKPPAVEVIPQVERAEKEVPPPVLVVPPAPAPVIAAGTPFSVRIAEALSSRTATAGKAVAGALSAAVVLDGKDVIPAGAKVTLQVTKVETADRAGGVPQIQLVLSQVETGGKAYVVTGDVFVVTGPSRTANTQKKAGIGATLGCGASAVVGVFKKKARQGCGDAKENGASVGAAAAVFDDVKPAQIDKGALLRFNLIRPLTIE